MSKSPGAPEKKEAPQSHAPSPDARAQKGSKQAANTLPGGCKSVGCKHQSTRFDFCDEHFDHFKFGLIKKSGEQVPDYEKKIEHFLAHKSKKSAHKVA